MSLFSSVQSCGSCSFVVGVAPKVLIYKITEKRKLYKTFEAALFSGQFSRVVVFHNEGGLINFLRGLKSFDAYKIINIV